VSNRFLPVLCLYSPPIPAPISPIPAPILESRSGCSVSRFPTRPEESERLRGESSSLSNQSNWSDWLVPPCSLSFPLNSRHQFLLFPLQFGFPLSCCASRSTRPGRPKSPRATTSTPK
jgi:hypothetical protein